MKTAYLDGAALSDRQALHTALARQLDFPAWYGGNLDALYDLLTESPGDYSIIVTGAETLSARLGRYFDAFRRVMEDSRVSYRETGGAPAAKPEAGPKPEMTPKAEPAPGPEAGPEAEPAPGPEAGPEAELAPGPKAGPEPKANPKPNPSQRRNPHLQSCNHKAVDLSLLHDTLEEYAGVRGSLISILQKTQEIYGYIPIDAVYHIAEHTGLSPAKILGVATFYSQFRFQAIGKYLILLCKGTACYVNGADRILEAVTDELGIRDNQTTEDGLFSLSVVSCLGCCSLAPVMMVNDRTYGSLTPDKVRQILRTLRKEAEAE